MKNRHENDVTNRISLVFVETKIELWGLISPGGVYDENRKDNDLTDHVGEFNAEKLSWLIRPCTIYDKN